MSKKDRDDVIAAKDLNCELLNQGLRKLRENNSNIPYIRECLVQGSHAMHTMIHDALQEYDIDMAIIFDKDDINMTDDELKKMVCDALTIIWLKTGDLNIKSQLFGIICLPLRVNL